MWCRRASLVSDDVNLCGYINHEYVLCRWQSLDVFSFILWVKCHYLKNLARRWEESNGKSCTATFSKIPIGTRNEKPVPEICGQVLPLHILRCWVLAEFCENIRVLRVILSADLKLRKYECVWIFIQFNGHAFLDVVFWQTNTSIICAQSATNLQFNHIFRQVLIAKPTFSLP